MTTGTKLWTCAGLLVVAAVSVAVRSGHWGPALRGSFVRYTDTGAAVIAFTNCGRSRGFLYSAASNIVFLPEFSRVADWRRQNLLIVLEPQDGQELLARPVSPSFKPLFNALPSTIPVYWRPFPDRRSKDIRQRLEVLLSKVGINIASTGFVATVDLPPR